MTEGKFIKCSRANCQQLALVNIHWQNPKIHTDGRQKIWSSCAEHEAFLVDYLQARGFGLQVKEIK